MGRFAEVWSEEHRNAVVSAKLDDRLTYSQILTKAKSGELAGLQPFDMPHSTARSYVDRERRRREKNAAASASAQDIPQAVDGILQRALMVCDKELCKLEKATKPDILALERIAKTAAGIKKQAGIEPRSPSTEDSPPMDDTAQAEAMVARMRQRASGTTRDTKPQTVEIHASSHPDAEDEARAKDYLSHAPTQGEEWGQQPWRQDIADELAAAAGHA